MTPEEHQIEGALEGYKILREHMIVYVAWEERTRKTLTTIIIAEMCKNVENVLVLTTKAALPGWLETLEKYHSTKNIVATNYHQAKHVKFKPDLVILDEPQNYMSGLPKKVKGKRHRDFSNLYYSVRKLTYGVPLIYSSATPHAQGYQQLYPQLFLSKWSPWKKHLNFYNWFEKYGRPSSTYVNGREVQQYTKTKEELCRTSVAHLFMTKTRKELDFPFEPVDKIHYIELTKSTRDMYNELLKTKVIADIVPDVDFIADSPMKYKTALHMIESGCMKMSNLSESASKEILKKTRIRIKSKASGGGLIDLYIILPNDEKCSYIMQNFGDHEDLLIYYNYIAEKLKLEEYFKHAEILQGTTHAEGIDRTSTETIIVYSQDFKTNKYTQRRARQAGKERESPINVHFLLVKDAISEQVYETVSINKTNFVDTVFERLEL